MKEFIKSILNDELADEISDERVESVEIFFNKSQLIQYLDYKMGAIYGNSKSRRSLANIYAIYSILHFYINDFFNRPEEYRGFTGYGYTKLVNFCRSLYGGAKLQNHALNSRVNGEFENKFKKTNQEQLIITNDGKYLIHIDYLYVDGFDIGKICSRICEEYISILQLKDNKLVSDINELISLKNYSDKKDKISEFLVSDSEARIFEIISYAILKNHYRNIEVYFGYSMDSLVKEQLTLYKTGRTNANDGGIDFVMKPLGRFFQVTEVDVYNKYLLDIDKVMHYPVTFVVKTTRLSQEIYDDLKKYINTRANGMKVVIDRYYKAIEEIITINELKKWLYNLNTNEIDSLLRDIDLYYKLELNIPLS